MKSITYIISKIDKAVAFEWIMRELDDSKFKLSFILLNNDSSELEKFIQKSGFHYYRIPFTSKKDYPKAIIEVRKKLKELRTEVVHCHMRDANFIGLSAAKSLGIKKRIYTRHYSTYNHVYYPKAVKYDRVINKLATDIVAISKNVEKVLIKKENVNPSKISLIHHGFDLQKFMNPDAEKVEKLKSKYNPNNKWPVIGVIARFIDWKGHKYIIDSSAEVLKKYPNALFIFANASGPQKSEIQLMINEIIPENHVEIEFENDLYSLYQLFDVYVHTPIDQEIEAFGQTYVEALASGIPSVFTLSGVAVEFVKENVNALTVPFKNSALISEKISLILESDDLRKTLKFNGTTSMDNFELVKFINKIESLYA